jgi:hypothetical protein
MNEKKKGTPTNRERFLFVRQRPVQDEQSGPPTRDFGEHFPPLNVAIRLHGVKNGEEAAAKLCSAILLTLRVSVRRGA